MLIDPREESRKKFYSKISLASAGFIVGIKKTLSDAAVAKRSCFFIEPIYNLDWIFSYLRGLRTSVNWAPLKSRSSSDVHSFLMNEASMLGWGAWLRVWPWAKEIRQIWRPPQHVLKGKWSKVWDCIPYSAGLFSIVIVAPHLSTSVFTSLVLEVVETFHG